MSGARVPAGRCVNPIHGGCPGATVALPGCRGRTLKPGPDHPRRALAMQDTLARECASWLDRPNACAGNSAQESRYVEQVFCREPRAEYFQSPHTPTPDRSRL